MPAATTDKIQKVGASTVTTLAAPGKALSATSITVGSTTNYPSDTGITIAMRIVDSSGALVPGTYTEWLATVTSGTTFGIDAVPVYGADQVYPAGSTTQVYMPISSYWMNLIATALLTIMDQDATLKAGAVDNAGVVADGILTAAKSTTATNIETRGSETIFDHVASGLVWSGDAYGSTLLASMTAGVVYIAGQRIAVSAVNNRAFTASRDTYIDVGADGVVDYNEVTNNNASPALSASHIRIGIIVTGGSNIASVGSVNQGQENKVLPIASSIAYAVTDSLGNLICPRDPSRRLLGYRQIVGDVTGTTIAQVTGLSCPVISPTNRKIKITAYATSLFNSTSGQTLTLSLWSGAVSGGTQIGQGSQTATAANEQIAASVMTQTTPSSSSVTYNLGASSSSGTWTYRGVSGSPAFIRVELL